MLWRLAGLTLGVLILAAAGRADDPKKPAKPAVRDELQRFQGTWQVESWTEGGEPVAAKEVSKRTVFFGANAFVFKAAGKVTRAGVIRLDPDRGPRAFDAAVREGEGKDTVLLGVYEFAGDAGLTLCFDPAGDARPKGVKPDPKGKLTVVVLRRPKPPADEAVGIVGRYDSEVTEPDGKKLLTEATIERRGDGYLVTYTKGEKLIFVGTAIRRGDQLSMAWVSGGQAGVSVYKIAPGARGPTLTGDFTTLGGIGVIGREVLTPYRRVD